jgi:hypothetical protein
MSNSANYEALRLERDELLRQRDDLLRRRDEIANNERQITMLAVERVLANLDRQLGAEGVGAIDRQGVFHKVSCRCLDGQYCAIVLDEPWPRPGAR